jgi:outer membrane protein insertion porin family
MVKQVNKFKQMSSIKRVFLVIIFTVFTGIITNAQEAPVINNDSLAFENGKEYILGDFTIKGLKKFSEQTVKVHSGLTKGSKIKLPGDKLTSAIKRLYETDQFSKVDVYLVKLDGNTAYLEFDIIELPQLDKLIFPNLGKAKSRTLKDEANIKMGDMVTDNLLVTTKNFYENKYKKEGFLKTKVTVKTREGKKPNTVDLLVNIDKGDRIKIRKINIDGNEELSAKKLRKKMKNTKQKKLGRFWKRSKYVESDYKEDLHKIIDTYSEKGFRDAIITDKRIVWNDDNTIDLNIKVSEGKKYFFRNIDFIGNTVYTDEQLKKFLGLEKGDVYNSKVLKERVSGDGTPDSEDLQSLYLNRGYLFANVTPVETRVLNDSIDVEIRIYEDDPATIRKVDVVGNTRTNDHVIYRELYTKPGNLFSKEDIIRSIREIGQLGFFDAENIVPDVKPNQIDKTVDIIYSVAEKGSSQIELQGGYGGNSFIGTLGLSFNNFSIKNIFKKEAYKPLPMGDGQALSLRLQKSKFYSTYSFSFTEPWLGGKKPKSLSVSVYNSRQFGYTATYDVNKDQGLNIWGASLGLGERLNWPDNYFQLMQSVSFQRYELSNYRAISSLSFSDGDSNNISYNVTFSRNSAGPNPVFPTTGSNISLGFKFTPPFSLLNDKDYSTMEDREKYKWLEYYKTTFKAKWFTPLFDKVVLMTNAEFGILGYYNEDIGYSPFERYIVGGDGLSQYRFDGSETIGLRGYENGGLSDRYNGGTMYNKFTLEARYPITLKPSASIYVTGFLEAGNSYNGVENFNPFYLKRAAGAGVRIFMPAFGLLGIDFAHGFDALPGASEKSGWQTHFIIGQQF